MIDPAATRAPVVPCNRVRAADPANAEPDPTSAPDDGRGVAELDAPLIWLAGPVSTPAVSCVTFPAARSAVPVTAAVWPGNSPAASCVTGSE